MKSDCESHESDGWTETSVTSDRPYKPARSPASKEDLSFDIDDDEDILQHRLSPMFGASIQQPSARVYPSLATVPRAEHSYLSSARGTQDNIPSRPQRGRKGIDLEDGKTMDCNRDHTFEDFVPQENLGVNTKAQKIGATWDVVRAVAKLKRPLKKLGGKRKTNSNGMSTRRETVIGKDRRDTVMEEEVEKERLLW